MQLKNGAVLKRGEYRIEKLLGQGGFGITYLATQTSLNRKVAIKEFFMKDLCERDADTSSVTLGTSGSRQTVIRFKEKFIREARTIASLRHPNIVNIYDVFEENGTAYYVMEYHDGGSLSHLSLPLPLDEAVTYVRQLASALSYLHKRKTMHLDIKPANVLIDDEGNAVLIDFGVSKHYDEHGGQTSSTPVGVSSGYAPIEQYSQSIHNFTPATDIYSLGATLYKLLTGVTPPESSLLVCNPDMLDISSLPTGIAALIKTCMTPNISSRPQSIKEFMSLLDSALESVSVNSRTGQVDPDPVVIEPDILEPGPVVDPSEDKTAFENDAVHRPSKPSRPASKSSSHTPQSSPKKKSRKWLWWLLALLVTVICAAAVMFMGNEPKTLDSSEKSSSMPDPTEKKNVEKAFESAPLTGTHMGYEWVDLGLSVKWATCNVGALNPGDYGNHYAWGEVVSMEERIESDGQSRETSLSDIKGNSTSDIRGNSTYDAARANWGGDWRLPTKKEFQELRENCTWEWTAQNSHNGYKVTSEQNGQSIFLPAAGYRYGAGEDFDGSRGYYLGSSPYESDAYRACYLYFHEGYHYVDRSNSYYYYGHSVRPVLE